MTRINVVGEKLHMYLRFIEDRAQGQAASTDELRGDCLRLTKANEDAADNFLTSWIQRLN